MKNQRLLNLVQQYLNKIHKQINEQMNFFQKFNKFIENIKLISLPNKKMYTGYKPNTSISKSTVSGLNQTQLQSLQRQVDTYTKKLELQKRKYFAIQDQHKTVSEQYAREKQRLNLIKKQNTKAESIILQAKVKNLDANLDKAVSAYDDTIAYNNRLKGEIDMLRRQKKNYIEMQRLLQQQLRKVDQETTEKMQLLNKKKKKTEDLKQQIIQTKTKNEQERESYINKFSALQKEYLGNPNDISQSKVKNNEILLLNAGSKPEIIDTQPLLRYRLKRIISSNKQKMRLIEQYKKHMTIIQEAFNQIQSKSNITDLDQITATFIKSEEQNYSLYNYIDSLTQNIDRIEQQNRQLEQNIQKKIAQDQLKREGLLTKSINTPIGAKSSQTPDQFQKNNHDTDNLINLVSKIKPALQSALIDLADSPLTSNPKSNKQIDEYKLNLNINDRNIEEHLSQLEKHIHLLQMAKQEAQTKTITQLKQGVTVYSKPIPSVNYDEVMKEKEKIEKPQKDQTKFWEENKFRQYAKQFWEKRKGTGLKGPTQSNIAQQLGNQNIQQQIIAQNSKQLNGSIINL